jgi:hypothetical protein
MMLTFPFASPIVKASVLGWKISATTALSMVRVHSNFIGLMCHAATRLSRLAQAAMAPQDVQATTLMGAPTAASHRLA